MIHRLVVNDPATAMCPWWPNVEWLKGKKTLEFSPGLNILFGPNGSGKSTVLTTIAKYLCCFDGDHQLVGQDTLFGMRKGPDFLTGVEVVHDGSPIIHFDPSQHVGMIEGAAAFDWDFCDDLMGTVLFKGSAGQTTLKRMNLMLSVALGHTPWPEVVWKSTRRDTALVKMLAGDGTRSGGPTLLLDEPSANLDLRTEMAMFKAIKRIADSGVQVIVATHSMFALHFKGANYIDTEPSYHKVAAVDVEVYFREVFLNHNPEYQFALDAYIQSEKARKVGDVPLPPKSETPPDSGKPQDEPKKPATKPRRTKKAPE